MQSINPFSGKTIQKYSPIKKQALPQILSQAEQAYQAWSSLSLNDREEPFNKLASILLDNKHTYAKLMAEEMGKPITQGVAEIEKCAACCQYYLDNAESMLEDVSISYEPKQYISFIPIGAVFAIMPWNFPFWQVIRHAAPSMLAGNVTLLKHAHNVCGIAQALQDLFDQANFPTHAMQVLIMDSDLVEEVIRHPIVGGVTLTGSTGAGKAVAQLAGKYLKKSVLELGGSDPYIVCSDADLDLAVAKLTQSRMTNNGQSCIAAKRFIIEMPVYDKFVNKLETAFKALKMGDPLDDTNDIGPLAKKEFQIALHQQVQGSIEKGAKCIIGGTLPEGEGALYPPTILTDVKPGMPAYDEELFGPVASVIKAKDIEEAIRIANDTCYGLGGGIFSENITKAEEIAKHRIIAGNCFVNDFVRSSPALPFGGIKQSGYGRELGAVGIKEFVNIKTISVG